MSADWQHLSLREAGLSLIDCVHKTPEAKEEGFPYVAIPQMKDGRIDLSSTRKISHKDFLAWTVKAKPEAYDIVISRRCNPGESAYVPEGVEFALGQNLVLLRSDGKKVYKPYLRWLLNSPFWWAEVNKYMNVGAIFTSLKCADMPNFTLPIPPLDKQIKTSEILSSLDNKIELNRQINQTLESMAQAIFKSWFVDFDPVKAKITAIEAGEDAEGVTRAAMRAISGKTDDELDKMEGRQPEEYAQLKSTAELFPSAMQGSELGEMPEGWGIGTIDEVTSLIIDHRGKTPTKLGGAWAPEGIPAISAKNIKAGRIVKRETIKYIDAKLYNHWMKDKLSFGDILLTSEAPLGEMLYLASNVDICLSQRIFGLRANFNCCFPIYLYFWLNSSVAKEKLHSRTTGSTVGGIRQSELRKVEVLIPSLMIQEKIAKLLENCMIKINQNEDDSLTLATIRDTLLPKLLSGELSVDAIEMPKSSLRI